VADVLDPTKQLIGNGMTPQQSMSNTTTTPVSSSPVVGGVSENETVAGQVRKLIADDSPLIRQAVGDTQQQAASRGLQNSSIAAQAGQEAVYRTVLPIAQQDASTNATRQSQNLSTVNQFGASRQQGEIQAGLNTQQGDINSRLQAEQGTINSKLALEQGDISSRLQTEQGGISSRLQTEQGGINSRLQSESAQQKSALLSQEGQQALAQVNAQTDATARLQMMDQNFKALMTDKEAGVQITLADKNFTNQQALLISEYGLKTGLTVQDQQNELARMELQNKNTLEQIAASAKVSLGTQSVDMAARLQGQYLASVSERMTAGSNEAAQIYQTAGLTSAQQANAVQIAYTRMQTDLATLASTYAQSPLWDSNWGASTQQVPDGRVIDPVPFVQSAENLDQASVDWAQYLRERRGG
jgi:hypothetical protein